MQKQTSLCIPKPCHEDWNKMTPTQQGKFCSGCSKQVVDFSMMTDNQILNFLSQQSDKLCGRFDQDQLQRPLVETRIKRKKSWWMALAMPLLFLFERSEGQDNKVIGDTTYNVANSNRSISDWLKNKIRVCQPTKELTGTIGMVAYKLSNQIRITGKVVDKDGNPIAYATIMQKNTEHGTVSDSLGNFSIKISSDDSLVTLAASYVGYETIEKQINSKTAGMDITMKLKPVLAGEVVVTTHIKQKLTGIAGGLSICYKITKAQKVDSSIRKMIGMSNVYPNPAIKGSTVHLKIKNAGNYQMQLLDDQSRLIQTETIDIVSDKSITPIQLPSNIASGIYYVRLVNEQKGKSYTEKLIIQ